MTKSSVNINRKLVFIFPDLYPDAIGGMEVFNANLIDELDEQINANTIIVLTGSKSFRTKHIPLFRICKRLFIFRRFGLSSLSQLISVFLFIILHAQTKLIFYLPYTSSSGYWGLLLPLCRKIFRTEYVLHCHGGATKRWRPFVVQYQLFKNAKKLLTVSNEIKAEYQKRIERDMEVVLPIIKFVKSNSNPDELKVKYGFNKNDAIILFVGSLKTIKGCVTLLDAFMNIKGELKEKYSLRLIFCGDGPLKETMMVKSAAQRNYIRFAGFQSREVIPDYYKMSDIFVIPSQFEGTPLSLLEAMSNKMTIIASDVRGVNNIITNGYNGYLFEFNDHLELSKLILSCLTDGNRLKMRENAFNFYMENYSQNNVTVQIMQALA